MVRVMLVLEAALSLWMLVDAYRRRAGIWWFVVILLPFGELAYLLTVKLPEWDFGGRSTVADLEHRFRTAPTPRNKALLAHELLRSGQYGRAAKLFEQIHSREPGDKEAMDALATCLMEMGEHRRAEEVLTRLVEADLAYADYRPCFQLASLRWEAGAQEPALELLETAARKSQRVAPKLELARYLLRTDRRQEVLRLLSEALADHRESPSYVKRRDRGAARQARALLREVS